MSEGARLCLVAAIALLGSVIQTVSGFGFGIVAVALFAFVLPTTNISVATSGLLSAVSTVYMTVRLRKSVNRRLLLFPLIASVAVSTVMVFAAARLPDAVIKRILACALILLSIYFFTAADRIRIKPTPAAGLIAGSLSGVLSSLFGMGGPPAVVYLLSAAGSPEEYMACIQCFLAVGGIYVSALRAVNGIIDLTVLKYWAVGLLGLAAGVFLGRKLFIRLDGRTLKKVVYAFMAASGIVMLITG